MIVKIKFHKMIDILLTKKVLVDSVNISMFICIVFRTETFVTIA